MEISRKAFKQLPDGEWPKQQNNAQLFMSAQVFAIQGNFPNAIWAQTRPDQSRTERNRTERAEKERN